MTTFIFLLFIFMIHVDCKITNFSLYLLNYVYHGNSSQCSEKWCTSKLHLMYFLLEYFDHFGQTMDESPPGSLILFYLFIYLLRLYGTSAEGL